MAEVTILCPRCTKPNLRTDANYREARFCQHCGYDLVLNNAGPRFYITRILKKGGQGAVYQGIDDAQQIVAVKEMLDNFTDPKERAESIEYFKTEAELLKRLSHPRIPQIYATFEDENRYYLTMEFVNGRDLEDVIQREPLLAETRVLAWAEQICDVLAYLHQQRPPIIFRDMKPSNVMIEGDDGVKLIDFGIAKTLQNANRGTQIGTPGYAPPEQYQGLATFASDIYALAATLHHALTGRDPRDEPPFSFPPVYGLRPAISKRTSDAIARALQMKPEDRYQTIAEFRAALLPPRPAQVRRAPAVAAAPSVTAAPPQSAQGSVPAAPPRQAPAASPPVAPAVSPPVPAAPSPIAPAAPPNQPAAPQPPPPAQRRRFPIGRALFALLAIALIAATIALAVPGIGGLLPSGIALPANPLVTPTAATSRLERFEVDDFEMKVVAGADVRQAFIKAYGEQAALKYGAGTQVSLSIPPSYIGGDPQKVRDEADGAVYRGSMTGYVAVP